MLLAALLGACAAGSDSFVDPALRLHGHNDYLQLVPLTRALELGLGSIEVDVYLVDGELRVGHERWQLRPGRTLSSLYLDPLLARLRAGQSLRSDGEPLVLLVDIKADGAGVYRALRGLLPRYRDLLTRFVDGRIEPGAVTIALSGARPEAMVAADRDRWCAIDGRLGDLDRQPPPPPDLIPWVSGSWRSLSDWTGSDELMPEEVAMVRDLVQRAHAQGRALRFWGAPDRREAWEAFFDLGVDRIGSDQPKKAARWLRAERATAR